jgi:hypothetical protein
MRLCPAFLTMTAVCLLLGPTGTVWAQDDFGSSYFTANTPAALDEGDEMDRWADQLGTIAPAAGGDDVDPFDAMESDVFPPEEDTADRLTPPEDAPILSPAYKSAD